MYVSSSKFNSTITQRALLLGLILGGGKRKESAGAVHNHKRFTETQKEKRMAQSYSDVTRILVNVQCSDTQVGHYLSHPFLV